MAEQKRLHRDTILGLVFFGGLALLLWATLNLSDLSFGGRPTWTIYFENAGQLQRGDSVMLLGSRIGRVEDVTYAPREDVPESSPFFARPMRVQVSLDREIAVREGSTWEIIDSSLLGGKLVELTPARAGAVIPEGEPMTGTEVEGPLDAVRNTFAGENAENISGLLRGANRFFETLNGQEGTVGALVNSRELYEEIMALARSLGRSAQAIEETQGALGRIINDSQLGEDVAQIASNLRSVTGKLDRMDAQSGLLSRLINDADLGDDVAGGVADLRAMIADLRAGRGPLGAILYSETMERDLRELFANAREITELAKDPEAGAVGALLADAEVARSMRRVLGNLEGFSEALVNGDGLLNRLVNDPELGEQFSRILRQVSRAIEDAREAAPIGTFINVLGAGL